jgi:hypothetical protein
MAQPQGRTVPSQFPQITLGNQKYDLRPLPINQSRAWRAKVKAPLEQIIHTVAGLPEVELSALELTAILGLIQHVFSTVADAPDLLLTWLYEYAPNIAEDKERIENEAFDTEVAEAFAAIVKQVYPLARLASALGGKKFMTS